MTKEDLAGRLNGRTIGNEITDHEAEQAKAAGMVVLFGASDDLAEFRGAIEDEAGCYDGGEIRILDGKVFEDPDCSCEWAEAAKDAAVARARTIEAVWGAEGEPTWTYKTDIPHATFEIMSDEAEEGIYCRGIVFELAAAAPAA